MSIGKDATVVDKVIINVGKEVIESRGNVTISVEKEAIGGNETLEYRV